MKYRCSKPTYRNRHYAGRGIIVCEEWKTFEPFQKWALSNGYDDSLTIERKNVNGNYEPKNCTWITKSLQRANTTKTTTTDEGIPWYQIAKKNGISQPLFSWRRKKGWSDEAAATFPVGIRNAQRERDVHGRWK